MTTAPHDVRFSNPKIYLAPDTSDQIATLRAMYFEQGRPFSSLAQVVRDAVFFYHRHMVELHGQPSNTEDFYRN